MTGFTLKKILSVIVHPSTGLLLLMLVVLLFCKSRPALQRRVVLLCVVTLLLLSSPAISNRLVSSLEKQHQVLDMLPDDTTLILVLGSGHNYRESRPPNSVLSATALSRLTEGVRLWHQRPGVTMMFSGAEFGNAITHASAMESAALGMGVSADLIVRFDEARDTAEEIREAVELLKGLSLSGEDTTPNGRLDGRLVVVSSATHLPRVRQMLESYPVTFSLAPTDFLGDRTPWYWLSVFRLTDVDRSVHEWVGMFWHYISSSVRSSVSP